VAKKVPISKKPGSQPPPTNIDDWVLHREQAPLTPESESEPNPEPEKLKRLTLDIPESLHKTIKIKATEEGATMADLLRDLLEKHFRNEL